MTGGAGSLRRRLTVSIIAVVGAALAILSASLSFDYERRSWERFDERLAEEAIKAAAMVDVQESGASRLAEGALGRLDQSRGRTAYQVWTADGVPLARFPEGVVDLPMPSKGAAPSVASATLPGGRRARVYRAWLQPLPAWDEPAGAPVGVTVAREVDVIRARISRHRTVLWGSTLAVVALAAAVSSLVVHRSLRDVARVSASIAAIDASSLGRRLELHGLPAELRPPFAKLNELLARLEATVERERQLSADVSHELRTPLAGLRAILEVSASRDRPAPEYRADLREALEVVRQLEAIVENLIMLARLGAGQVVAGTGEELALRELVEACFAPHAEKARRRGLRFEDRVPPALRITSEEVKLRLVLANLLSNAVEYTQEGGRIEVDSDPSRGLVVAVRDSGPAVPEEALGRLFDPFFRVDAARSGGEHFGIGLALVRGLCDTLGYQAAAHNEPGGGVAFTVSVAGPRSPSLRAPE